METRCVLGPRRVSKVGTDSADPLIQGFNPLDKLETARPIGLLCHHDTFRKRADRCTVHLSQQQPLITHPNHCGQGGSCDRRRPRT